jgi:hypothetical protein
MTKHLELYRNKFDLIKLGLAGILFCYIGTRCIESESVIVKIDAILCISFGIIFFVLSAIALFERKPVVVISEKEIIDRRIMKFPIPMTEIENLEVIKKRNYTFLNVTAKTKSEKKVFKPIFRITRSFNKKNQQSFYIETKSLTKNENLLNGFISELNNVG